ncbi:hypothetical protein SAMN05421770_101115 [Granulicella rosea]|uniref:Dolichyl-phosphate-mannose-protein mannosyltransferase n=2 Tax=Granulicella rosea TaxID=474952 RepID=A0A239CW18_9BACT|nr:hypothetical protein SAMN05421770_101115 [Granulicella rosea]
MLAGLLTLYLAPFLRYRPYDIDNPWFLSFSYNAWVDHIVDDRFMRMRFPGGMDGTQLFGRLAAALQGLVLAPAGWQQWPAAVLSSVFAVLALGLWQLQLRRLGYTPRYRALFLLAVGLSEPCVSMANKFRYEFLSFALISLGLLLVAYARPVPGLFIAALAAEIEPAALAGIVAALVLTYSLYPATRRLILAQCAALGAALLVYLALHPHVFSLLRGMAPAAGGKGFAFTGGFFASYFLARLRHLPELACFLLAAVVYWRRRQQFASHALALVALALTIFSIAMPHGNPSYMIFLYPALVALALTAFRAEQRAGLAAAAIVLYTIPQYLYLFHLTQGQGFRARDIQTVHAAVETAAGQLGLNDRDLRIYGDYRLWFAHPQRYVAAAESTMSEAGNANLYLCFDRPPESPELAPRQVLYCPELLRLAPLRPLTTLTVNHQLLRLYARQ